ncbi:hypothetical protein pb186bvf_019235 [Paramecium bursaria]
MVKYDVQNIVKRIIQHNPVMVKQGDNLTWSQFEYQKKTKENKIKKIVCFLLYGNNIYYSHFSASSQAMSKYLTLQVSLLTALTQRQSLRLSYLRYFFVKYLRYLFENGIDDAKTTLASPSTFRVISYPKAPVFPLTLILVWRKLTYSSRLITYHRELCHYDNTLSAFGSVKSMKNLMLAFLAFYVFQFSF